MSGQRQLTVPPSGNRPSAWQLMSFIGQRVLATAETKRGSFTGAARTAFVGGVLAGVSHADASESRPAFLKLTFTSGDDLQVDPTVDSLVITEDELERPSDRMPL